MSKKSKAFFLKYGIAAIAVIIVWIQVYNVHTQNLNKWKGGGYGMYTEIHYYYNQIHIPGMSVDSLVESHKDIRGSFGKLMLMPNQNTLNDAARILLETSKKDSIHIQIWKPTINIENGVYTRVLFDEIYLNQSGL
ncbi:MAG: hypothetical protein WA775_12130 [Psychroserpens sp.]|uniref:hypothetical protein n=1 Tax=Psychroserpens sp. TaxID=2020870 RepID=UPI003C739CBA